MTSSMPYDGPPPWRSTAELTARKATAHTTSSMPDDWPAATERAAELTKRLAAAHDEGKWAWDSSHATSSMPYDWPAATGSMAELTKKSAEAYDNGEWECASTCTTASMPYHGPAARGSVARLIAKLAACDLSDEEMVSQDEMSQEGDPDPRVKHRCCAACGERKYVNQLLLDMSDVPGEVGGSGDWQGQLWAYCIDCARERGMLLGATWSPDPVCEARWFKNEQRKRWVKRLHLKASRSRVARAGTYSKAREQFELSTHYEDEPKPSRRSQAESLKMFIRAMHFARDINRMIPSRLREVETAMADYRRNMEAEQKDWPAQTTPAAMMPASLTHSQEQQLPPTFESNHSIHSMSKCRRTMGL